VLIEKGLITQAEFTSEAIDREGGGGIEGVALMRCPRLERGKF